MTRRSTYNSQHTLSVKHPKHHTTMSKVNNFHSLLVHPFGFQRGALFWLFVLSLGLSIGGSSAGVMVHKGGSRSAGGVRSGSSSPTNVFLRMRYFEEDALHCVDCIDKRHHWIDKIFFLSANFDAEKEKRSENFGFSFYIHCSAISLLVTGNVRTKNSRQVRLSKFNNRNRKNHAYRVVWRALSMLFRVLWSSCLNPYSFKNILIF